MKRSTFTIGFVAVGAVLAIMMLIERGPGAPRDRAR